MSQRTFTPATIQFTRESIIQQVNEEISQDGGREMSDELFTDEVCQRYADLMGIEVMTSRDAVRAHFLAMAATREALITEHVEGS